eukprot:TRINITY_DN11535_c0_g1_i2.p1 TRINITY_DN11535_c0_g1~~TRINITY_DN11535_c0_g1_i2.p1  ORF type:complete len:1023 (+),score=324.49 TRINITY_DN11535_c0_g1_i2:223-3069(+)
MATPLDIEIEASNGASDYGNKFGEPVICGFTRSFGMELPNNERREWIKPIMFSAGLGCLEAKHADKKAPEVGNLVVKVGGPAYRVGMGGGAASSVDIQGGDSRDADLDFSAVQRGDAEMEQKMNRALRACIERDTNPILSIHDQGAGGNGNVLKELVEPAGAEYRISNFTKGDPTLSSLELWGAEYQENDALLLGKDDRAFLERVSARERINVDFVGEVTGTGKVVLIDDTDNNHGIEKPVDLDLKHVLADMPRKVFKSDRQPLAPQPLSLPDVDIRGHLDRVLRLLSVGSKRFLTNKVDRSVTGLIAQQPCVGPLHTPLADVAVTALSHFTTVGTASSIGEQPIIGLVDVAAGARMAVAEATTNLVFAPITKLADVKASGNWMWAAKLPGEGAALHDACVAMCDSMVAMGMALDGGKDSLSMAAKVKGTPVKAPGELVMSFYAPCTDITKVVTPDLQAVDGSCLVHVDINPDQARLGGSALAQVYKQLGSDCPDVTDFAKLKTMFDTTQALINNGAVLAGHDVSDGGVLVAALEMAFAGNVGFELKLANKETPVATCFAEECGLVLQVAHDQIDQVLAAYNDAGVTATKIGVVSGFAAEAQISVAVAEQEVLTAKMVELRNVWEATSFELEKLQSNPHCVGQEQQGLASRTRPTFQCNFEPPTPSMTQVTDGRPIVATVREEGSNGDREMVAALFMAGFQVWDVTMSDLCANAVDLSQFRGLVFVGGFSYADVCGSAKGWAATALFNSNVRAQLDAFKAREDTFSLGICNGCQLLALLGWIAPSQDDGASAKRAKAAAMIEPNGAVFTHNTSGRFESRFSSVTIQKSKAMMLKGMEGTTLGVWVAHGEGRVEFKSQAVADYVKENNLAPVRYVNDDNAVTQEYPFNPNGSPDGIAGLCSSDGRHLAMMPHPERCVLPWQCPYLPSDWQSKPATPWLQMFKNAAEWCS